MSVAVVVITLVTDTVVSRLHGRIGDTGRVVMTVVAAADTLRIVETHPAGLGVVTVLVRGTVMSTYHTFISILADGLVAVWNTFFVDGT